LVGGRPLQLLEDSATFRLRNPYSLEENLLTGFVRQTNTADFTLSLELLSKTPGIRKLRFSHAWTIARLDRGARYRSPTIRRFLEECFATNVLIDCRIIPF
jgi:hypothetical protein